MERTSSLAPAPVFAPKIGGMLVARYNFNFRDNAEPADDITIGGQMAYAKLNVTGNVLDESISYRIQGKFGEADGRPVLDDAYMDFKLEDEFSVRVGQFKPALLREENISDTKQLAANRSVMNGVYSQSRTQGLMLTYTGQHMRVMGSFNDGIRTPNIDFTSNTEADYGATGRIEFKGDGEWKQYEEFTSFPNSKYFSAFGAGLHWQDGGDSFGTGTITNTTDNIDIWEVTADAMAKGNGWNAYAAAVWRQRENKTLSPTSTFDDIGFLVQAGKFVGAKWELFARWDLVLPDNRRILDGAFNTITIGANKYISPGSHAVKLTIDGQWFVNRQSDQNIATQSTLSGLLSSNESGQIAIRAQLQIAF